ERKMYGIARLHGGGGSVAKIFPVLRVSKQRQRTQLSLHCILHGQQLNRYGTLGRGDKQSVGDAVSPIEEQPHACLCVIDSDRDRLCTRWRAVGNEHGMAIGDNFSRLPCGGGARTARWFA